MRVTLASTIALASAASTRSGYTPVVGTPPPVRGGERSAGKGGCESGTTVPGGGVVRSCFRIGPWARAGAPAATPTASASVRTERFMA